MATAWMLGFFVGGILAYTGGELERALDEFVPRWLRDVWGFRQPHVDP